MGTVRKLLEGGLDPFLGFSSDNDLFPSLSSALQPLTVSGYIQGVLHLLLGLKLGQHLWSSPHAQAFLFAVQARHDGSEEYETVLKDLVDFLCRKFLKWETESPQVRSAVLRNMKRMRRRCPICRVRGSKSTNNLFLFMDCALVIYDPWPVKLRDLFNYLCGHGKDELVLFVVKAVSPDTLAKIVNKPDSQGLTPLVHAACGGHLGIIRCLLDHGAELARYPGISPLAGALLYLALAPHNVGGDMFGKKYLHNLNLRRKILSQYQYLLPDHSFSSVVDDPTAAAELVRLLLPSSSESILPQLLTFPAPLNYTFTLLLLTAAVRDHSAVQPLLEGIISTYPYTYTLNTAGMLDESYYATVIRNPLYLAPVRVDTEGSRLFERFFIEFVPNMAVMMAISIYQASRKGYWDVVDAVVSNFKQELSSDNLQTCLLAIRAGKKYLVHRLLHSSRLPMTEWWSMLAQAAVRAGSPDMVRNLLSAGCDATACLRAVARLGGQEALSAIIESSTVHAVIERFLDIVTLAAKCNQAGIVQSLFEFFQSHGEVEVISKCSRDIEFWVWVLTGSTKHGHQSLALQAVSHISDSDMRSIASQHRFYRDIVYYSCYWGLSDLLSCLHYQESDLLKRCGQIESPIEAAIANGKLGCIPSPPFHFPLLEDMISWFDGSPFRLEPDDTLPFPILTTGVFHRMLSGRHSNDVRNCISAQERNRSFLFRPNAFEAFKEVTGNFCAPLVVFAMKYIWLDLPYGAVIDGNDALLEQILRVLFNSGYVAECFEYSKIRDVHNVVQIGRTSSLDLLLHCGGTFVNRLRDVNREGQNVLHSAVLSRGYDVEKLDMLLGQLGKQAPDMCLAHDVHGYSPISLAFSLGKYERADVLTNTAVKSASFDVDSQPVGLFVEEALEARGWFRALVEGGKDFCRSLNFSTFDRKYISNATCYFVDAIVRGNNEMTQALLVASCGWLLRNYAVRCVGVLNQASLEYLNTTCPSYIVLPLKVEHPTRLLKLFAKSDSLDELPMVLKLYDGGKIQFPGLDLRELFSAACVMVRPHIVSHILSRDPPMPVDILQKGMVDAFTFGGLEIVAEMLLSNTSSSLSAEFDSRVSPVVKRIFFAPKSYEITVEDLFESLAHSQISSRLSLSEQWLIHEWDPRQKQLVERTIGSEPKSPPNPWMVGSNWRGTPHIVEVTIDWESFAQCLLEPPLTDRQWNTPMLVEAVVFSSPVLGQFCPADTTSNPTYNLTDFFDCTQPPKSLVLSSVKWPLPPFAEVASPDKALLCLSYNLQEKVFVFPPVQQRTERGFGDESYSTDSGMHSLCFTDTSIDTKDDECNTSIFTDGFSDLCKFHQRRLSRTHRTSSTVAVEITQIDFFALESVLRLCCEVVQLSCLPTVVYAGVPRPPRSWLVPAPPPKNLFSHIGINVDTACNGEPSSTVVSLVDSSLDISVALATDNASPCTELPSHGTLLEQTVGCALRREVQVLQERLGRFVRTELVQRLERVLRSGLEPDSVCVLLENLSGNTTALGLSTVEHLLVLKASKHIRTFLVSFSEILRAYSHKPRVFANIRSWLLQGLCIVVGEASSTSVTVSPSRLQLVVNASDLRYPHRQGALVSLTDSLLRLSQLNSADSHVRDVKSLLGEVPCPFLSCVNLKTNASFLYPVVGQVSKLLVQVVGYGGENLTLPLKYNCALQVTIGTPSGTKVSANSSEEPSARGASGDLFVSTADDGRFEVVWRPTEEGRHSIQLTMNGAAIQQSFERVYVGEARSCAGKAVVSAGSHLEFVAAHVGSVCPFTNRDSKVVLVRDTVIKPAPLLKDIPGFQTFTVPFRTPQLSSSSSSSSSSNTSLRPSDQLKELLSVVAGQREDGGLEPSLPLLHHLSLTAAHRGNSRQWSHTPTSHVTVHISSEMEQKSSRSAPKEKKRNKSAPKRKKQATKSRKVIKSKLKQSRVSVGNMWLKSQCRSLGNGMYRVSLQCTKAGTYSVFASCPFCQSVMRVCWLEEQSFYPQPFYVVPGPFSAVNSTVTDVTSGTYTVAHTQS